MRCACRGATTNSMMTSRTVSAVRRGSAQRSRSRLMFMLCGFMSIVDGGLKLISAGNARHLQKPAKSHPAAAYRFAIQRILWKPRQESRDRDRAFEPRQRHSGALMRAGAEGEVAVRGAADVEMFGIGKLQGIAVGSADAQRHRRARGQRDAAEFDGLDRDAVAELV